MVKFLPVNYNFLRSRFESIRCIKSLENTKNVSNFLFALHYFVIGQKFSNIFDQNGILKSQNKPPPM